MVFTFTSIINLAATIPANSIIKHFFCPDYRHLFTFNKSKLI